MYDMTSSRRLQQDDVARLQKALKQIIDERSEFRHAWSLFEYPAAMVEYIDSFRAGTRAMNYSLTETGFMAMFPSDTLKNDIVAVFVRRQNFIHPTTTCS